MTTLTAPEELRASVEPTDQARLRLWRAGRLDRTVPLADGRCTIGSSPRCQLRLPAPDAQPLQCLVALESDSAEVIRWAAGVLLNGRDFSRQQLAAGDRLSIGAWELEWQPAVAPSDDAQALDEEPALPATADRETTDFDWVRGVVAGAAVSHESENEAQPLPVVTEPTPTEVTTNTDITVVPSPAPRETAKTLLVSSRKTDFFNQLLGPAKPVEPEPQATEPAHKSAINLQVAEFQDRLVQRLWTRGHSRRDRLRAVINETRTARTRIEELTLALESLEQLRTADQAVAEAGAAESEQLRATIQAELASAVAERDRLSSELAELRSARPRTAPPDPRLQTLADELAAMTAQAGSLREQLAERESEVRNLRERADAAAEERDNVIKEQAELAKSEAELEASWEAERAEWKQHQTIADQDADRLREQLYACESQIEVLREQLTGADAARAALDEQVKLLEQQQAQWLAECQDLERDHAAALAEVAEQRDQLRRQVDELTKVEAAPVAVETPVHAPLPQVEASNSEFAAAPPIAIREEASTAVLEPTPIEAWREWESTASDSTWNSPQAEQLDSAVEAPIWNGEPPSAIEIAVGNELPSTSSVEEPSTFEPAVALAVPASPQQAAEVDAPAEPERPQFTPTSFIDKYRHLLEDSGDAEPTPPRSRQLLDEEYLPSKSTGATAAGEDDADEALEAYMSNLMRRVRGDSPTAAAAAAAAARFVELPAESTESELTPALPAVTEELPNEIDANGMLRLARRPPVDTNLAALRELANASARTAIARHRQRRHVESAVSKGIICVLASGASAFLMLTAPDTRSLWFWGGCVTLAAAAGSGAQLAVIAWQRLSDRRHQRRDVSVSPALTNDVLNDPAIAAYEPAAGLDAAN